MVEQRTDQGNTRNEHLSQAQQENLITMLSWDDKHGKLVAGLADPALFEGDYQLLATRMINYWHQYGKAPKHHTADLFAAELEQKSRDGVSLSGRARTLAFVLRATTQVAPHLNSEYVLDQVRKFTRRQKMKDAIIRAAERFNRGAEGEEIEQVLASVLHTHEATFEAGLPLSDLNNLYRYLEEREVNEFSTGLSILDRRHAVPTRKTVMVFLGATGQGKSWFMVQLGKKALRLNKVVLHVTLEMSAEETQLRYYQALLAVPGWEDKRRNWQPQLVQDGNGRLLAVTRQPLAAAFSMRAPDRDKLQRLIESPHWLARGERGGMVPTKYPMLGNLRIIKYPMRGLSVAQLRATLQQLEAVRFMPDLLLIDYVGIMATDSDNYRISLGRVLEELRGLADERNIAVVTAQQISKEGAKAATVNMTHVAEDWSLTNTADIVLCLTRSAREQRQKLARITVDKVRHGEMGYSVVLTQNYDFGQFGLQCCWPGADYDGVLERLEQQPLPPVGTVAGAAQAVE
jgi:replicative DNA helicase